MYFNVILFKSGKTMVFTSETPYSVDKTANDWSIITDIKTGQTLSFRGSEIVSIVNKKVDDDKKIKKKKPSITTAITTE